MFGDAISDVYSDFSFKKECPDAPGVNAYVRTGREVRAGGAANVAANLALLAPDTRVDLIAALDTELAYALKNASQSRVDVTHSILTDGVIEKERIYLDGKLSTRLDSKLKIDDWTAKLLLDKLDEYLYNHDPDLVVVSDYAAGALTKRHLDCLPKWKMLIDTKLTELYPLDGSLVIKLNRSEWETVVMKDGIPESHTQCLIVTNGSFGAELTIRRETSQYSAKTHSLKIPGHNVPVVDVCGCGDTFLAGLAASLLTTDDPFTAMQFANAAAATVVSQPRTAVANRADTLKLLGRNEQ